MTPNEIAGRAAEAVMRKIEDTRRINKREIAEAIEGVLRVSQTQSVFSMWDNEDAAYRAMARVLCGND